MQVVIQRGLLAELSSQQSRVQSGLEMQIGVSELLDGFHDESRQSVRGRVDGRRFVGRSRHTDAVPPFAEQIGRPEEAPPGISR